MQKFNLETFVGRYSDSEYLEGIKKILDVFQLSSDGPWLAGGSLRAIIQGIQPKTDFDFFFKDIAQKDAFIERLKSDGAKEGHKTEHATNWQKDEYKIQTINIKYYSSPEELINSFDFSICQLAYDGANLYLGDYTLWDLARKRLVPNDITYGLSSFRRIIKYTDQGFYLCSGGLTNMLNQIIAKPDLLQSNIQYID